MRMQKPEEMGGDRRGLQGALARALIFAAAAGYLFLFWSLRVTWTPAWFRRAQDAIQNAFEALVSAALGGEPSPKGWRWAATSVVMGLVVPWLVMAAISRGRPRDIGLRAPNRIGWRLIPLAYLLSVPALFLMARAPSTRLWYEKQLAGRSMLDLLGTYLVVIVAEHFTFHGVLLGLLRSDRRWPVIEKDAAVEGPFWQKALRFVGLAQPTSGRAGADKAMGWLGLPEGCLAAMVYSAAVFGVCHIGKSPSEALLSFPGGLALGYVAYRSNSLLVPLALHVATGLTALAFVWLIG